MSQGFPARKQKVAKNLNHYIRAHLEPFHSFVISASCATQNSRAAAHRQSLVIMDPSEMKDELDSILKA
jgi:hypothetical protein